ncbi:carbohydrate esterase family 4 protein [Rhizoctonia solani AG-1 IB]|uniref:Carbohydrate esterase family 4 protein n=1 Tax=Thanatephorus cucumeris (strain AG1-IB / isolate 7/3/14) TaxID=1108050 RepID=M5CC86_THACB|nr:carbohydrate esterase family 4 protein [Rhizoctonia solani AG-1 IB]
MRFSAAQITTLASALFGVANASSSLGSRSADSVVLKCREPNTVAITFDDGPYNWTEELVHTLDNHGAKGTFFVNGNNYGCIYSEDNVKRIQYLVERGHQIASHTWRHEHLPQLSGDRLDAEFRKTNEAIKKITGCSPAFMRPPYGEYNDEVVEKAAKNGQTVVIWDFDSADSIGATAEQSKSHYDNILGQHPSSILTLNHETIETTPNQVIPYALQKIQEKGFKMVTVAECLGMPACNTQTSPATRDHVRQNLTYQQKIQVLDFYHLNKHRLSMESMIPPLRAMGFTTICQSTISRFVKNENQIRQCAAEQNEHAKRASVVVLPEVEDALLRWIQQEQEQGHSISGDAIVERGRGICDELQVPEDQRIGFSRGWLDSFKKRNGLSLRRAGR